MTEKEIDNEQEATNEPEVLQAPLAKGAIKPSSRWSSNIAYPNDAVMNINARPAYVNGIEQDNLWSTPWSSLMMVLFAVLIMLISLQPGQETTAITNQAEAAVKPETANPDIDASTASIAINKTIQVPTAVIQQPVDSRPLPNLIILTRIRDSILEKNNQQILASLTDDGSIKINLAASLLFEQGQASLIATARQALNGLLQPLSETPYQINIIGHTDDSSVDITQYQDHWALSLARASEVARFLIESGQIEAHKFTIMGRAQYDPVASNLSATSRAMNRRVEIIITQKRYLPLEDRL